MTMIAGVTDGIFLIISGMQFYDIGHTIKS